MTAAPYLLLRADASSAIGLGHVMRCLALAQAWQDAGGVAEFVSAELPARLVERLRRERIAHIRVLAVAGSSADAAETLALAEENHAAWIAVDGYRFGPDYYEQLRTSGRKVLALDDMVHLDRYPVDVLLNQNLSADPANYAGRVEETTELLLGPRFSLLRREFRAAAVTSRASVHAPLRVLMSFGGGDVKNFAGRMLRNLSCSGRRDLTVVVLAGAANPHVAALRALAESAAFPCEIRVSVEDVAAVMAWADVAITAAGSTVWELASMRLPALIGAFEDNQLAGLEALSAVPIFRVWPIEELVLRDLTAEVDTLLARPTTFTGFDAQGATRVVERLQALTVLTQPVLSPA